MIEATEDQKMATAASAEYPPDPKDFLLRTAATKLADSVEKLSKEVQKIPAANRGNIARISIDLVEVMQTISDALADDPRGPPMLSRRASLDHNADRMNDVTREELDAKLELLLTRSDARARETELQAEARLSRFEERMDSSIGEMRRNTDRLEGAIGSLKTTTIVTAVSAVLAIVFGVAAFNATVLSNMVASFESGKNTVTAIGESTKRLEQLQDRIEAQQKQAAAPPK